MHRNIGLLLLIAAITTIASAEMCDICGTGIEGGYYTYRSGAETSIVCDACENGLGHCVRCGIPVAGTRVTDANVLCRKCRLEVRRCAVCGTMLLDVFYADDSGHAFCPLCQDTADRCALCNTILLPGQWSMDTRKKVCNTCRQTRPRCAGCDSLIGGQYSVYKGFDGMFCEHCVKDTPMCQSCLRPCGPNPHRLNNGAAICPECARTAIVSERHLRDVVMAVTRFMERDMLMTVTHPLAIRLEDSIGSRGAHETYYRESGRFVRLGEDFTIKILIGLSQGICTETVAHELAHAWQAENWPGLPGDELVEGFAQWVAARVLAGMGYSELVERLYYRDDVYGRGYRRVAALEEKYGFSGVFRELERLAQPR